MRRAGTIFSLFFFAAILASALIVFASHTKVSNTAAITPPQKTRLNIPRLAVIYASPSEAKTLPRINAYKIRANEVATAPWKLKGYRIAVVTKGAAQLLSKHPNVIAALLREGVALLVEGPKPLQTLLAGMKPSPNIPLTLLPLTSNNKPGLPVEASAAALIPAAIYPSGKIAPRYIVFHNTTIMQALNKLIDEMKAKKNNRAALIAPASYPYDGARRWYYVGDFEDNVYVYTHGIAVAYSKRWVEIDYTPDYNGVNDPPGQGLWRVIAHHEEHTSDNWLPDPSRVIESHIPTYNPILGWRDDPNILAINVSYYIDQNINAEWPDMGFTGPVSESLTPAISSSKAISFSYTLTIPDSIVEQPGGQTEYSSYFNRIRLYSVYWLWGYQSIIGHSTDGSMDAVAYPTAPLVATDTRWPLARPGLYVGVRYRDVAIASILVPGPGGDMTIPGVVATRDDTYRFYVTTTSMEYQGHT